MDLKDEEVFAGESYYSEYGSELESVEQMS